MSEFCASSPAAQALPEGEFWEIVFHRYTREHGDDIDPFEGEPGPVDIAPCAVCGATDFCGYDQEGRPMIHADCMEDDDE